MGWQEVLFLLVLPVVVFLYVAPIVAIGYVAGRNERSRHYIWWPVFLGLAGAVIALIIIRRRKWA